MDIEIERPIDRPATLRLTMTNLSHLFNFKLFDNSTSGKWEASLYKWAIEPGGPGAVALPDGATGIGLAGREGIGGSPFAVMGPDMTEGYAGGTKGKNKRVGLQYFPLQTGTKIQLRMGYTNNPDALFPVFSGIVTEIEPGEETITITAQARSLRPVATKNSPRGRAKGWPPHSLFSACCSR